MTHIHVQNGTQSEGLRRALEGARRIALDCEAAGFHRYTDRLCLLQLTIEAETYVVDPFSFDPSGVLRPALEDPEVTVIMHGADFDLRLLGRDLGIRVEGLFDTQIAATLLGEEALGLAALLESRLGVKLSKKYQRADWAQRPLSDDMLEYAAHDTRYLPALADTLEAELRSAGRLAWAQEECRVLETVAIEQSEEGEPDDPVTRIKGARHLDARQVTALREALSWRDEIARAKDKALFRVVGDQPLIEAVACRPRSARELAEIKGFPTAIARAHGEALVERLLRVSDLPEQELEPYPRRERVGSGRPPPEVEELAEELKRLRNRKAEELGLPRGTLLSNAVALEIAKSRPRTLDELEAVAGMRRWKTEVLGDALLAAVR